MKKVKDNKPTFNDYLEWDVGSWKKAIELWISYLNQVKFNSDSTAIEIGGRRGGLSLFLAHDYSIHTTCSDLINPNEFAKPMHDKFGIGHLINYDSQNCLKISHPENTFDIIIFKSVIGALGSKELQQEAISEIYRCLKPGGCLLFAENGKSTFIHNYLRKKNNIWSSYWYYPSLSEINMFLNQFSICHVETYGFFAIFFRNQYLKSIAYFMDSLVTKIISNKNHSAKI